MAVDKNGQLYFTFEDEMLRLIAHVEFLNTKGQEISVSSKRFLSRMKRIVKLHTYCIRRGKQIQRERSV